MGMSLPTVLPEADRAALIACVNRPTSTQRDVLRARIILTWPDHGMRATARLLGCAKSTVVKWRDRYRARGLPGLRDLPRSGAPRTHGDKQRRAVAAVATTDPPRPWGSWTHARLAAHVNSLSPAFLDAPDRAAAATPVSAAPVSRSWVGRVLRDAHIRVHRVRGWLHRKPDPQFEERIAAIEAAVAVARRGQRTVLCLDEKTALPVRTHAIRTPTARTGGGGGSSNTTGPARSPGTAPRTRAPGRSRCAGPRRGWTRPPSPRSSTTWPPRDRTSRSSWITGPPTPAPTPPAGSTSIRRCRCCSPRCTPPGPTPKRSSSPS